MEAPRDSRWVWNDASRTYHWWDGHEFTATARADAAGRWVFDRGVVANDRASSRRGRRIVVIAIVVGVVLFGGVTLAILAGSGQVNDELFDDTYTANLTKGSGDFVHQTSDATSTSYESDGYHLRIGDPTTWWPSGVRSHQQHTVLSIEIESAVVAAPDDAAFGPFCWMDPTHGYGEVVSPTGHVELVELRGYDSGDARVLASGDVDPASLSDLTHLMITCAIEGVGGSHDATVGAYVGGKKVVGASAHGPVTKFEYFGFAGRTAQGVPAEWRVTRFWRHGPDDLPADARS